MKRRFGGGVAQPEGSVRRSQVVTTYGPGSMVDLLDEAVLIGGLDSWYYPKDEPIPAVDESRLRDAIAERFRKLGRELSIEDGFRSPPVSQDSEPTKYNGIRSLEFPRWFVCQNCHGLEGRVSADAKHFCEHKNKHDDAVVPVRFVAACKRGHVDDFPWNFFVHAVNGKDPCGGPSLSLHEGKTGDFSEIEVRCACGEKARLNTHLALPCSGQRPWLGRDGREECPEEIRLTVRTASNSYFPQVMSALSIPDPANELREKVRPLMEVLGDATLEDLPVFRKGSKVKAAIGEYSDVDVLAALQSLRDNTPLVQGSLRSAEFTRFMSSAREVSGDLPSIGDEFFARTYAPKDGLPNGLTKLVLAHKLREVAALIGFTRLEPASPDLQGEYDLGVKTAALGLRTKWLPATEMLGEGVFIAFDEGVIRAWEERDVVVKRTEKLQAGFADWVKTLTIDDERPPPAFPGARFYMLHSLSHLLMSAISLECGYAASAIRERIYCAPATDEKPMAAILLSTGSPGSGGTLGGLVEQGRRIREHLQRAFDMGRLCSNDPVCSTHSPKADRAERFLEGAACHGCLFVSESSCERFNRNLDRALVVPSIGHPVELAFFSKRP